MGDELVGILLGSAIDGIVIITVEKQVVAYTTAYETLLYSPELKFYSNTRFSLETVTLEAFVGGYIKR